MSVAGIASRNLRARRDKDREAALQARMELGMAFLEWVLDNGFDPPLTVAQKHELLDDLQRLAREAMTPEQRERCEARGRETDARGTAHRF